MKRSQNYAYQGDLHEVFHNPVALLGGVVGTALVTGLLTLVVMVTAGDANADQNDDSFQIDFEPGALVKLGQKIPDTELPQKIVVQETRAEEDTAVDTVTTDEKAAPPTEPPKEVDKKEHKTNTHPTEHKDSKLPTSKLPTEKNTPYNDLPTVTVPKGDPFGDPQGWSDMAKDGDPWATSVMKALNNMPVGAYAAKASDGDFKFQLTICKDGSVGQVAKKGGSLPQDMQDAVRLQLSRLQLPRPPSKVASQMKSNCAKIKYTFVWSARGVR